MEYLRGSQPSLLESLCDRASYIALYPFNLGKYALNTFSMVSFLAFSSITPLSGSLNLLFFYLTWSTLVLSHAPLRVELYGTLMVRLVFYILPSLGFLAIDNAVPSLAVNVKEHGDIALAMGQKQGGLKGRWNKIALVSIGNVIMGVILQATIEYILTDVLHMRSALKVTIFFPMPWGIAKDVLLGLLFRDILTYVLHRYALHSNNLAAADLHRKWQHAVPAPYSLVAHFDHPLPYLLHIFFPTYIPAVSFRFHLLTYCIYLSLISLEETFAYSGYNVMPSGFILGGIARRQERHLMGSESGNYGCYGFSDLIAGTSLGSDVLDDMRDQKAISDDQAGSKGRAKAKTVRKKK